MENPDHSMDAHLKQPIQLNGPKPTRECPTTVPWVPEAESVTQHFTDYIPSCTSAVVTCCQKEMCSLKTVNAPHLNVLFLFFLNQVIRGGGGERLG